MCLCVVVCVIAGQGWMSWVYFGYVPMCGELCDGGSGVDDIGLPVSQMEEGVGMCLCVMICVVAGSGLDDMVYLSVKWKRVWACASVWWRD